ncbi:MAG: GAF domain-containing protein [Bacteroidetes bacterium]|nr:GAF domain-containing protein [Bacteroidota bacterium]
MDQKQKQIARIVSGEAYPFRNDLNIYRILSVIAAIVLTAGWFLHLEFVSVYNDPLIFRLIFSSLFLSFFILSFFFSPVRDYTVSIFYTLFSLCSIWILSLNFINNFSIEYSIGIFFVYLVFAVGIREVWFLAVYTVLMLVIPLTGLYFSTQSLNVQVVYTGLILVVLVSSGILLGLKLYFQNGFLVKTSVLSAIFKESSDMLFVTDADGYRLIAGNERAMERFGFDESNLKNLKLSDLFVLPGSWDGADDLVLFEVPVKKTGSYFWADIAAKPLAVSGFKFVVVRITDVTQRKGAEEIVEKLSMQRKRLLEISQSMLTSLSLDDIFSQISGTLKEIIDYNLCALFWVEPEIKSLKPLAIVKNNWEEFPIDNWLVPLGEGIIGRLVITGESELVNNCQNDPRSIYPPGYQPRKEHIIAIPVRIQNEVHGVFSVTRVDGPEFSQDDFELIQLFITHSIAAIQNGILYDEANRRALHSLSLMEVTKAINSTIEVDQLLDMIVEKVLDLTHSRHGALFLLNAETGNLEIGAFRGIAAETVQFLKFPVGDSIAGYVAQTGRGMLIHDVQHHPNFRNIPQLEKFTSMISIPLKIKGKVVGVMGVDRLKGEKYFSDKDFKIAQDFAEQAALALENARLFEQINQSERKYRTLFEETEDAVFVSSLDGRFLDMNPAGIKMFGYETREEILNISIARDLYFSQEEREALVDLFNREGSVKNYEITLKKKDGLPITVLQSTRLVKDSAGNPVFLRGIMKDMTEQRKLQLQLFQSQKMDSIGQLAGGMAHDFNNILGGILGYSSFLKSQISIEDEKFRYIDAIEKSAGKAAELISKLLAFARGSKSEPVPVSLNKLVNETLAILERTFDKSIEISTTLDTELPLISGDPIQLQQVILNLSVNARDAITGKGKIEITTRQFKCTSPKKLNSGEITPGKYIILSVSDSGMGMEPEIIERIFEPFFSTKEIGKGTGLGLAMVYGVVKGHEGALSVTSVPGEGSRFDIYIPVSEKSLILPIENEKSVHFGNETQKQAQTNQCILVVDDDASIRELAGDILSHFGYEVLFAVDGLDAISVFEKNKDKINLVLLDIMMPKMNGQEAYQAISEISPEMKFIFSSGFSQNDAIEDLVNAGKAGFIAKPYHVSAFILKIQNTINSGT